MPSIPSAPDEGFLFSGEAAFPVNSGHGGKFKFRGRLTDADTRLPLDRLIAMTLASILDGSK